MGANLALARWGKKLAAAVVQPQPNTQRFIFNLAYDRMGFNGLLFICYMRHVQATSKKREQKMNMHDPRPLPPYYLLSTIKD
jgi:hypothetical protein